VSAESQANALSHHLLRPVLVASRLQQKPYVGYTYTRSQWVRGDAMW
jgi:hypothetical protein